MFFCFIFFSLYLVTAKQIKNMNVPSCRNCIYYKPQLLQPYISSYSKCEFFGSKDINSDIISYDYADLSRKYEDKCGVEGKYFDQGENIEMKIFLHDIINNNPYNTISFFLLVYIFDFLYKKKLII
jgi:hypothetical protein